MGYLLDTHLLLWSLYLPHKVPQAGQAILDSTSVLAYVSAVSIAEIAIKQRLGKLDLQVDLNQIRRELMQYSFQELSFTAAHAIVLTSLPLIHKDPFDRMLVAQAAAERLTLLTVDKTVAAYGPMVLCLG